jgi:hypothetical protein
MYAKAVKDQKGEHRLGRAYHRPTIHDFPLEWLPADQKTLEKFGVLQTETLTQTVQTELK